MKALLDALDGVTEATAEAAFTESCGAELDAIANEIIDRLRRLDAEDRLDATAFAEAEAELAARTSALGKRFAFDYFDALIGAAVAVEEAR
jgi:hypothetical protein